MYSNASTVEAYLKAIPEHRRQAFLKLRDVIVKNMPNALEEKLSYGMIAYVVPHKVYPNGYHCDPALPLPFISLANQKNFIALYHMGIYADKTLHLWLTEQYP